MTPTIGEIRLFAGNFAPRSWSFCNGQLLSIAQNSALFSILGTTYGGDGRTTFALPDLRGRAPISPGQGPGLSPVNLGQRSGSPSVTLNVQNLPNHTHTLNSDGAAGTTASTANNVPAKAQVQLQRGGEVYDVNSYGSAPNATMGINSIGNTGGNISVSVQNPYLGINYIICLYGIFPSRN